MSSISRSGAVVAATTAALFLSACGSGAEGAQADMHDIEDARGTVSVPVDPQSVYVADWAMMDTLAELDVEVDGAVKQTAPAELVDKYEDATDIGSAKEVDVETLAAGEPDLIIVGARASEQYDALAEVGPTVDLSTQPGSHMETLTYQSEKLGEIFGVSEEVDQQLAEIQADVDRTRANVEGKGTGLVLMVSGGKVSAFGPGSRFGLIHDDLGVQPAAPDLSQDSHGQVVSFEFIAETDPDWIFVLDRDKATGEAEGSPAAQVLDNALVDSTTAAQQDQILELDPVNWYIIGSGLGATEQMIDDIDSTVGSS